MMELKFKFKGIDGNLTVTCSKLSGKLNRFLEHANTHAIIDELTDIVVQREPKVYSCEANTTAEGLAELNGLSDIRIATGTHSYRRLV